MAKFNKDEIKNGLTIEQVYDLVAELGGEPRMSSSSSFVARTICHNVLGEGSHKLYYYDNTKLFQCYTDCGSSFDIYELLAKVKNVNEELKIGYDSNGKPVEREWLLPDAMYFVAIYFGIDSPLEGFEEIGKLADWEVFAKYQKREEKLEKASQIVELKVYEDNILQNLPKPRILPWEEEGILPEVIRERGIAFDPITQSIIIPHHNSENQLVGIRQRTLIKEDEKYGKYRPAILNGVMYNHPLGFNLYNLNNSKINISLLKKVIIFEGERFAQVCFSVS